MLADHHTQARLFALTASPFEDDKILPLTSRREFPGEMRLAAKPCGARKPEARELQTARRARPLARRALMTARPPRVFMRSRKPCVRARRVFEGW